MKAKTEFKTFVPKCSRQEGDREMQGFERYEIRETGRKLERGEHVPMSVLCRQNMAVNRKSVTEGEWYDIKGVVEHTEYEEMVLQLFAPYTLRKWEAAGRLWEKAEAGEIPEGVASEVVKQLS